MELIKVKNYKELSKKASEIIVNEIHKNPKLIMGFATGKTPIGTYKNLVKEYKKRNVDFSNVKTFNLDEYYPVKDGDKKSYKYYMFKHLFNKVNIKKENINLLNGNTKNVKKECKNYEEKIRKNPIDFQIVGIGVNGHIGFNEPGSNLKSKTRLVNLAQDTIKENKYLKQALTVGISTILKSKKILLLASGNKKAKVIYNLINKKPNKSLPASFLKIHKDFIVIVDRKASSLL